VKNLIKKEGILKRRGLKSSPLKTQMV